MTVAVGCLLWSAGAASAGAVPATSSRQSFTAPYAGTGSGTVFGFYTGCGNTATMATPPYFNLTSGAGVASLGTTSGPCAGQNSSASQSAEFGLVTNSFSAPAGGTYHLKETWVATLATKLAVHPGTSSGTPYAAFWVYALADLSASNGKVYFQANYPVLYAGEFDGTFTHTYSHVHLVVYLNATLPKNATRTYSYFLSLEVEVATGATPGTASTSASVNMASGGKQGNLTSYSVHSP